MNNLKKDNKTNKTRSSLLIVGFIVLFVLLIKTNYAIETNLQAAVKVLGNESFINIYSPIDNNWYNTRSLLLNISLEEKVKYLYYKINSGSYGKLCSNCKGYTGIKNFVTGENNLTIKAVKYDNTNEETFITFYIDIKEPKIMELYPISYGNGLFGVKYAEDNLRNVILYYGLNPVNPENKKELICLSGTGRWCYGYVNLLDYNRGHIYYKFELKDWFFSINSSITEILVDVEKPVLNVYNPTNNALYTNKNGKVYFNITVNEKSRLEYSDNFGKETILCSSCTYYSGYKKFSFGQHNVTLRAVDLAGNYDRKLVSFELRQY